MCVEDGGPSGVFCLRGIHLSLPSGFFSLILFSDPFFLFLGFFRGGPWFSLSPEDGVPLVVPLSVFSGSFSLQGSLVVLFF